MSHNVTHHAQPVSSRRQAKLSCLLALLLGVVTACGSASSGAPPGPPTGSTSPVVKLNGPVGNVGEFVYGLQRPRHGSMQDVYALELLNHGQPAAVLDAVRMAKEKDASALRFAGAFVAPPDSNMFPVPVRQDRSLQPLQGYRLQPLSKTNGKAPVLVLRVGPALPGQTKGFQYSRNNNVNLFYHTPDGTHYVVVYPVRIEYPNG